MATTSAAISPDKRGLFRLWLALGLMMALCSGFLDVEAIVHSVTNNRGTGTIAASRTFIPRPIPTDPGDALAP